MKVCMTIDNFNDAIKMLPNARVYQGHWDNDHTVTLEVTVKNNVNKDYKTFEDLGKLLKEMGFSKVPGSYSEHSCSMFSEAYYTEKFEHNKKVNASYSQDHVYIKEE